MSNVLSQEDFKRFLAQFDIKKADNKASIVLNDIYRADIEVDQNFSEISLYVFRTDYDIRTADYQSHISVWMGEDNEFETADVKARYHTSNRPTCGTAQSLVDIDDLGSEVITVHKITQLLLDFMKYYMGIKDTLVDNHMTMHVIPWREMVSERRAKTESLKLEIIEKKKLHRKLDVEEVRKIVDEAEIAAAETGVEQHKTLILFRETEQRDVRIKAVFEDGRSIWMHGRGDNWSLVMRTKVIATYLASWVQK